MKTLCALADESLAIAAVSGTSAGAMNAAVLACGLARGGRQGARAALRSFWDALSASANPFGAAAAFSPLAAFSVPGAAPGLAQYNLDANPFFTWINAWMGLFSPYQFNPLNLNALREVVAAHVTDAELQALPIPLYVTATSVRSGQPRIFSGRQLLIDALMASACLPQLFRAVTIGGEPFWDGGFVGNPALWPMFNSGVDDIVLVQLDPLVREGIPTSAVDITDRLNEITFNASLTAEMRAIRFVQRLHEGGHLPAGYSVPRLHRIADDDALKPLTASSKYNTDARFLGELFQVGRAAAVRWLQGDRASLGQASGCDINRVFLQER